MTNSVPRAIVELEQLREKDPALRELIEIILRLLKAAKPSKQEQMKGMAMATEPDWTAEVQRILDDIDLATKLLDKPAAVGFLEELISGCEALQEELNGEDDEDEDEDESEAEETK
jgi:hypothetical protein